MALKVRIGKIKTKHNTKLWVVIVELKDSSGKRFGPPYFQGRFKTKTEAFRRKVEVERQISSRKGVN